MTTTNTRAPAELKEALEHGSEAYAYDETFKSCQRLCLLGRSHDPPWHWGYRVYRTTYSEPNSDADFEKAMNVLSEYVRSDIFYTSRYAERKQEAAGDVAVREQLWKRFHLDVVQDPVLEGASVAKIHELAKEHVHSQGLKVYNAACHRFFMMIDNEVVKSLLSHAIPTERPSYNYPQYGVKLLDTQFDLSESYWSGDESDSSDGWSDADVNPDHPYEGWFWISPSNLLDQWCSDTELFGGEEIWSFDRHWHPIHRSIRSVQSGRHDPAGDVECSCGGRRWA